MYTVLLFGSTICAGTCGADAVLGPAEGFGASGAGAAAAAVSVAAILQTLTASKPTRQIQLCVNPWRRAF